MGYWKFRLKAKSKKKAILLYCGGIYKFKRREIRKQYTKNAQNLLFAFGEIKFSGKVFKTC